MKKNKYYASPQNEFQRKHNSEMKFLVATLNSREIELGYTHNSIVKRAFDPESYNEMVIAGIVHE